MKINHNISALKANNMLSKNDNAMGKSLEKLTSGFKINNASDDPAGMAISRKMRSQIKGLEKASSNAADGISVIQTAEGALEEVSSCLQRMNELSVQAANGVYTKEDRDAIQLEINQLNEEIERISATTEFNTKKLLDGSVDRKAYTDSLDVKIIAIADEVTASDDYKLLIEEDARQAVVLANPMSTNMKATDAIFGDDIDEKERRASITINGEAVVIESDDTVSEVYEKIRDLSSSIDINCFITDLEQTRFTDVNNPGIPDVNTDYNNANNINGPLEDTDGDGIKDSYYVPSEYGDGDATSAGYVVSELNGNNTQALVFVSELYGSRQEVVVTCDNDYLAKKLGLYTYTTNDAGQEVMYTTIEADGVDAKVSIAAGENAFANTATIFVDGKDVRVTDNSGFEINVEVEPRTVQTEFRDMYGGGGAKYNADNLNDKEVTITVLEAGEMSLHIGANAYQTMKVTIPKVTPKTLGVENVNVRTISGAEKAIDSINDAIVKLSTIRAKLGAYENRLEHAIANLDTTNENMTESLSRIEDTDMAKEMATYTQYSVLVQAGTSMLAQANERPQNVLSLLQ